MKNIAKTFNETTETFFNDFLSDCGFLKTKSSSDQNGFSITYRNGDRYVNIAGTLHPLDYPYYFYLAFGEGSDELPDSDWNLTALLQIIQEISPADYEKHKDLYKIYSDINQDQIEQNILTNRKICEKHGMAFLNNDLDLFYKVRSSQNRDREPYKIYKPDEKGN